MKLKRVKLISLFLVTNILTTIFTTFAGVSVSAALLINKTEMRAYTPTYYSANTESRFMLDGKTEGNTWTDSMGWVERNAGSSEYVMFDMNGYYSLSALETIGNSQTFDVYVSTNQYSWMHSDYPSAWTKVENQIIEGGRTSFTTINAKYVMLKRTESTGHWEIAEVNFYGTAGEEVTQSVIEPTKPELDRTKMSAKAWGYYSGDDGSCTLKGDDTIDPGMAWAAGKSWIGYGSGNINNAWIAYDLGDTYSLSEIKVLYSVGGKYDIYVTENETLWTALNDNTQQVVNTTGWNRVAENTYTYQDGGVVIPLETNRTRYVMLKAVSIFDFWTINKVYFYGEEAEGEMPDTPVITEIDKTEMRAASLSRYSSNTVEKYLLDGKTEGNTWTDNMGWVEKNIGNSEFVMFDMNGYYNLSSIETIGNTQAFEVYVSTNQYSWRHSDYPSAWTKVENQTIEGDRTSFTTVNAKYVMLKRTEATTWWEMAEVNFYGTLGEEVTQSITEPTKPEIDKTNITSKAWYSDYGDVSSNTLNSIVDASMPWGGGVQWTCTSCNGDVSWIAYDLGNTYDLSEIKTMHSSTGKYDIYVTTQARLWRALVDNSKVTPEANDWTKVAENVYTYQDGDLVTSLTERKARYVLLKATDIYEDYWVIDEIYFYGTLSEDSGDDNIFDEAEPVGEKIAKGNITATAWRYYDGNTNPSKMIDGIEKENSVDWSASGSLWADGAGGDVVQYVGSWCMFDLGDTYNLTDVETVVNTVPEYDIYVSEDSGTWQNSESDAWIKVGSGTKNATGSTTISFNTTKARYVMIKSTEIAGSTIPWCISEVNFYAAYTCVQSIGLYNEDTLIETLSDSTDVHTVKVEIDSVVEDYPVDIIIALYKDGVLIDSKVETKRLTLGANNITTDIDMSASPDAVEIYMWNSINGMYPITIHKTITKSL